MSAVQQVLFSSISSKEIGWATYWNTQDLSWDEATYMLGGLALTTNGNVFGSYSFATTSEYSALYGCNTTTGASSFIGQSNEGTNSNPSFAQTGCLTYSSNSIAIGRYFGASSAAADSAPAVALVSMATPSSPSITFNRYQGANNAGTNGNQYGLASDGTYIYTSYNSSEGYFVTKYNSSGTVQWTFGNTTNNTYFQLGVNTTYNATYGYACEVINSTTYGISQFNLSTGANVFKVSISPTGAAYFGDPYYTSRCCVASDGGVIVAAGKTGVTNAMLARISSTGTLTWAVEISSTGRPMQVVSAGGYVYVLTRYTGGTSNGTIYKVNESTGACVFALTFSAANAVFPIGMTVDGTNNAIYTSMTTRPNADYYRTFMWRLPTSGKYVPVTVADLSVSISNPSFSTLSSASMGSSTLVWNSQSSTSTNGGNGYASVSPTNSTTVF